MFCSKCGTQVEEDALFCYKCGSAITQNAGRAASSQPNNTQTYTTQPNPSRPAPSYTGEPVKDRVNIVYPDGHSEIGDLYISDTELVFVKKSKSVMIAFGFLGNRMEKGEEKLCFRVSDIVNGQRTRIGLNRNVYQINLRSGESYRLCLNHPKTVTHLESMFG